MIMMNKLVCEAISINETIQVNKSDDVFRFIENYMNNYFGDNYIGISLNTNTIKYPIMFYIATKKLGLEVYENEKEDEDDGKVFLKKES